MSKGDGWPAFPALVVAGGCDGVGVRDGVQHFPGMSLRAYLVAHAPPVPGDYERRSKETVESDGFGRKFLAQGPESELEQLVRWRLAYADAVLEALK